MGEIQLPLFPLPVVLFPGTPQLLHIFEPRYRQMVRDCLDSDRRFGLSYLNPERKGAPEGTPLPGDVGCMADIRSHQYFPDGRSNIIVVGQDRYVMTNVVVGEKAYLVGEVQAFHDEPDESPELVTFAAKVRGSFESLIESLRALTEPAPPTEDPPEDPRQLSFHISAALELDGATKETLLRLTSTRKRLELLSPLLEAATVEATRRQAFQRMAKRNGKAGHAPKITDLS
jgi:Lon protease-like protein